MTYEQALSYLASVAKFGIQPGLHRIEKLLALMGNPERQYRTIHVTGTNGKGSTTAFIAAILNAAGIRTGMFTSPHLVDYTERIVISGNMISEHDFAAAIQYTSQYVEIMTADGYDHPTEFEILTAAAFYHFAVTQVEYAVIEVGMGGLLDSTNVIRPQAAVITNVAVEHTDRCGATVAEIAAHKAGIIKPDMPVITAAKGEALNIIYSQADNLHAPLFSIDRDFFVQWKGEQDWQQQLTVRTNKYGNVTNLRTKLLGIHQAENCACAVMVAQVLAVQDSRITPESIRSGVAAAVWPGRFEVLQSQPTVIVDGAHNPAGAEALRLALNRYFGDQPITFVFGVLADKDIAGIIARLFRPQDQVITVAPLSDRAADAHMLSRQISAKRAEGADTLDEAIAKAEQWAGETGVVCICGSLYLIGSARKMIVTR